MEKIRDDHSFYDDLSRLNSELVNLQRELAKKNAELRQHEKSLRVERDFAETLLNTAQAVILVLDTQGRIVRINRFLEVLLGYAQEDIRDNNWLNAFISPEDHKPALDLFRDTLAGVRTAGSAFRVVTKDARHIDIEWHMSTLKNADGDLDGLLAIGLDITERKKNEESFHNRQKLESLGLIAGGIAHNFNNLMGGIFGYLDMASDISGDERVLRYLSKAGDTIDRAKSLTGQLLTFAKGGAPIQAVTSLIPFLQETAQSILSRLNIPCDFDIAGDLWPCSIDKDQIQLALDNIIINARQAMPVGETVGLTARNVSLGEKEQSALIQGRYVKISIKDHGIGIERKNLSRIFDPFYTTKPLGQGLGLATSYSIINRHGGAIDVESEPGKGSTFHIYLPASSEFVSS
jgi:PAS domain S-box-containing protein